MNQQNAKRQTASAAKNGPCEAAGAPLRPITQGMDKSPPLHQPNARSRALWAKSAKAPLGKVRQSCRTFPLS